MTNIYFKNLIFKYINTMNTLNDEINTVLKEFLDDVTKFHYLNYHYSVMLNETNDEEYLYKLECLYEWWEQEAPLHGISLEDDSYHYLHND